MQLKNNDFIEKLIFKAMLTNKRYNALVSSSINPEYFESSEASELFKEIRKYFKEYKDIPEKTILENIISEDKKEAVSEYIKEIDAIDVDVSSKYDFIVNETDQWIKENALKEAILKGADILNSGNVDEYNNISALIKGALTKTLKFDMGTNYFEDVGDRLKRMFNTTENRITTGYPTLDEIMAGGIPSKSLTMLFGRTHGNKCVSYDTKIKIKKDDIISEIEIGQFIENIKGNLFNPVSDAIMAEEYDVDEYSVFTNEGWINISKCYITKKHKKFIVRFKSGRSLMCADKHILINRDYDEIYAEDLKVGDSIISEDSYDTVVEIIDTKEYDIFYDIHLDHHHLYYTNGLLSHNSGTMINMISRQVLKGKNVILFTLEMSEDMTAQRFDAIFSGYDINRIYVDKRKELVKSLTELKKNEERGTLIIKEWPTGAASTANFKSQLYELEMRDLKFDIGYADYLGLMTPETKMSKDGLYEAGKQISVDLRGLSFEFDMPIVSVSQMNRNGSRVSLYDTDFTDVAESYGISATADFISILGIDESLLTYQNELHYKIVKNRFGGRVGTIGKFYFDPYTLKLYDDMELDMWMDDAIKNSNEPREVFEKR